MEQRVKSIFARRKLERGGVMKTVATNQKVITNFNNGYYGLTVLQIDERHEVSSKHLPPATKMLADVQSNDHYYRYVVNYNIHYFFRSINDEQAETLLNYLIARIGSEKVVSIAENFTEEMEEEYHVY